MKIETISSIDGIKSFCKENFTDICPFINYNFFNLLEKTNCTTEQKGWKPEHIIVKQKGEILAFIPNFRKFHSYGEFVFDQIFENAFYQLGYDYFPKFLSAIPFTPVTRNNFFYSDNNIDKGKLYDELKYFFLKKKVSSFHLNFISENTSKTIGNHFLRRTGLQYHWKNKNYKSFEDFLSNLKSRKRKNIIKERQSIIENNISFKIKTGADIKLNDLENLYYCYAKTINKKWSKEYLTKEFFLSLGDYKLLDDTILICAYENKSFIGCSVHFNKEKNLYGRYWGALYEIPNLHFELCYYQAIDYAIENKLELVEAGAQGEHKISRGYLPVKTYSNHWFNSDSLIKPIKNFLKSEEARIEETIELVNYKHNPFNDK